MSDSFEELKRLLQGNFDDFEEARVLAGALRESGFTYRQIGSAIKQALGVQLDPKSVSNWIGGRNPRKLSRATRFARRPRICFELESKKDAARIDHLRQRAGHSRKEMFGLMWALYKEHVDGDA